MIDCFGHLRFRSRLPGYVGPRRPEELRTMPQIALGPRNVFVLDGSVTPSSVVAGCCQFGGTTNSELYMCLNICFQQPRSGEFRLMAEDRSLLPNDGSILPAGSYYVVTASLSPLLGHSSEKRSRSSPVHICGVNG